jgi:signal transduction histidine kinase
VVQLTARCTPSQVARTVQDNGLGLSPEQLSDLLRLFRRLYPHVEGSGVGFYSIKKLIDNTGGTIEVASELGVCSISTGRLPW